MINGRPVENIGILTTAETHTTETTDKMRDMIEGSLVRDKRWAYYSLLAPEPLL